MVSEQHSPAPDGPEMAVSIGAIRMKNPVMVASGTFGYGPEYADIVDLNQLGAMVVKGVSREPWDGNPLPRLVEVQGGLVNAIGLQGPGVKKFIKEYLAFLRPYDLPVIVNIWGKSVDEYIAIAADLDGAPGIAGLEINISCPNVKAGGAAFGTNLAELRHVVAGVRRATRLPVIPKLAPNVTSIADFARAAEDEGADAISLINSYPAMVIDVRTRKAVLANKVGGLSGPAIHPIAVKLVWEAARAVHIPVIGMGGIVSAREALEFLIAGATAVAVGTANFSDPTTAVRVRDGIRDYLVEQGMPGVRELVGSLQT